MFAVLRKSFMLLPSDRHRLMFLDAALMLRGCPPAHLTAFWEGALLLHDGAAGWNVLPKRKQSEDHAAWQSRRRTSAAKTAAAQLDYLLDTCLVVIQVTEPDSRYLGDR